MCELKVLLEKSEVYLKAPAPITRVKNFQAPILLQHLPISVCERFP